MKTLALRFGDRVNWKNGFGDVLEDLGNKVLILLLDGSEKLIEKKLLNLY